MERRIYSTVNRCSPRNVTNVTLRAHVCGAVEFHRVSRSGWDDGGCGRGGGGVIDASRGGGGRVIDASRGDGGDCPAPVLFT